jgi:hypothetical protein
MTETPSNSHDGTASPRYPTQAIADESAGLRLPYRCSASALCSALLPRTRFHVSTIASFLDARPPYKSNFYCHPGRAGGTPMLLARVRADRIKLKRLKRTASVDHFGEKLMAHKGSVPNDIDLEF